MIYAHWQPATTYAYIWQAGFEQLSLQLGKQLEQASNRVCALQGTMHASLDAATERLLSASRAEAELEVHSKYMGIEACGSNPLAPPWHLAPCSSRPTSRPALAPRVAGEARPRARRECAPARGVSQRHRRCAACGARRAASGMSACVTLERPTRLSPTESQHARRCVR